MRTTTTTRFPSLLLAITLASQLGAQTPLAMPFTGTTGSRVAYFDLTVHAPGGVTLTALDLHCTAAAGTAGTVQLYVTPGSYLDITHDPELWTPGPTATFVSAGPGAPSFVCLGAGLHLGTATWGIAVAAIGVSQAQSAGVTCTSTTIPGSCANALFTNAELTFAGGASGLAPFTNIVAHRRIWNGRIHYALGNVASACAGRQVSGSGCFASVYQYFADAAVAHAGLEGRSLCLVPAAGSYQASWGGGVYLPPGPAAVPVFATPTDDGEAVVTPSQPLPTPQGLQAALRVHSNGVVAWGPAPSTFPGTVSFFPTADAFLNGDNGGIYSWHDYNEVEPGSGRILREERSVGGSPVLLLTWNGVENYSAPFGANPGTVQFQLDLATGLVVIVWPDVDADPSSSDGSAHLVGWSPGGQNRDPGSIDFATSLPLIVAATDAGVRLGGNEPRLGTTWQLASEHVGPLAPIAFQLFGTVGFTPGIDLGFAGASGCRLYQSADLGVFAFPVAGGTGAFNLAVPAVQSLAGITLHTQSAALTLDNALGIATSNGLWGRIGW